MFAFGGKAGIAIALRDVSDWSKWHNAKLLFSTRAKSLARDPNKYLLSFGKRKLASVLWLGSV
jgi:hypothetical protein